MGQRLESRDEPIVVRLDVRGVPSGTVTFHTDRGTAHRARLPDDGTGALRWRTDAADSMFVRVEVRHPGGQMAALTNPVVLAGP